MATFLDMSRSAWQEAGMNGQGPGSVSPADAKQQLFVRWVRRAWRDIQASREDWSFMREDGKVLLAQGESSFAANSLTPAASAYYTDTFMLESATQGRRQAHYVNHWTNFSRDIRGEQAHLHRFAVDPRFAIVFDREAIEPTTVTFEYHRQPVMLTNQADVPDIPEAFHDIIVFRALMYFAGQEESGNLWQYARQEYDRLLGGLVQQQTPPITWRGNGL